MLYLVDKLWPNHDELQNQFFLINQHHDLIVVLFQDGHNILTQNKFYVVENMYLFCVKNTIDHPILKRKKRKIKKMLIMVLIVIIEQLYHLHFHDDVHD